MKTSLPLSGLPLYVPGSINVSYFTTVYLGNYISGDYNENVGSHCGVDIDATKYPNGQADVYAVMDGTVKTAGCNHASYGNYIVVKHPNCIDFADPSKTTTYYSCYLHLSSLNVTAGQSVNRGVKIGVTGNTGNSTSAHLHFQIDCASAPFHPYWPFTTAEYQAAGYTSFNDAVNHAFHIDQAKQYTINPLLYIQQYLDSLPTTPLFTDIANSDEDYDAIKYLKDHGVIEGYSDGSFKPDNPINRAELLKMAFVAFSYKTRTFSSSSFPDVSVADWFFPYVETAKQDGLIQGYTDGNFKPGNNITRAETLKVLLNTKKIAVPVSVAISYFSDVNVASWYTPYVNIAYEQNIIDHTTTFSPHTNVTRRHVARWIYRMII